MTNIEIPIQADIRKIQSKDIGNFSFKQAAFLAAGAIAAFATFKLSGSLELSFVPMAIIVIFGFFKPYGMSCATFIRTFLYEKMLTPKTYLWESDFEFDEEAAELYMADGVDVSEGVYAVIQTAEQSQNIKWTKADKERIAR